MSRILVVVQWEIKVDQVLCCSFNANGAIWHYIGKGLEPVFLIARQHCGAYKAYIEAHCFGRFYTSGFCKYTAHTASLDFAPLFVRAQLRQSHTLHKPFILIRSHSIHWSLQYNHPCQYCWSNPCMQQRQICFGRIHIRLRLIQMITYKF